MCPQTALAAIIMVNLLGMFKQFRDIAHLWRTSKIELSIWLTAFVASVLLGLDLGLLVAIAFGILTVVYRTQNAHSSILGQVPDTALYLSVEEYEEAVQSEGIKIFQFSSSIYFANSDRYISQLKEQTGVNPEHIHSLRKAQKKKSRKSQGNHSLVVCADAERGVSHALVSQNLSAEKRQENGAARELEEDSESEEAEFLKTLKPQSHSVILDWSCTGFIDSVGAKSIKQVIKEFAAVETQVVVAGCNGAVLDDLERLQFFTEIKRSVFFPTVHDAVLHCQRFNPRRSPKLTETSVTETETCV